jgi:hypothetical protein
VDLHQLATMALYLFVAVVGWFVRVLWEADHEMRRDLMKLQSSLPETYVRRDDLREWKESVMTILQRIESKLDGKADK